MSVGDLLLVRMFLPHHQHQFIPTTTNCVYCRSHQYGVCQRSSFPLVVIGSRLSCNQAFIICVNYPGKVSMYCESTIGKSDIIKAPQMRHICI